jgi:hypothetical protein
MCINASNGTCPFVCQEHVPPRVNRHTASAIELRIYGQTSVTPAAHLSISGHPRNLAGLRVNPTNGTVAEVRQVKMALVVLKEIVRVAKAGLRGRSAITRIARNAITRKTMENSLPVNPPQTMRLIVNNNQISISATHHSHGPTCVGVPRRNSRLITDTCYQRNLIQR